MSETRTELDPRIGTLLGSRYRLEERLASGGMATVYRARDEILGRAVAVKVMHPAFATDAGFVERFRREAQNAARLNHPNIVTVHDGGEQDGTVFLVMELVEGTTLRELILRFGRLDPDTAKHVVAGVAAALDHAHAKGLVHRDVKPENVLMSPDGRVKVVDFGVARAVAEDGPRLTGEGAIGTMAYVAPEQLASGAVDGRADVYALGLMTYEMLTGRPAFDGDTPAAVAASRFGRSVPSPGVSPEVDGAVAKATALAPDDRYETAGEFSRSLGEGTPTHLNDTIEVKPGEVQPGFSMPLLPTTVLDAQPAKRRGRLRRKAPETAAPQPQERTKRRRWPWLVLVTILLVGSATAGYALYPRTALVPSLVGNDAAAAEAALEEAGLVLGERTEAFHDSEPGTIVDTAPAQGTEVRLGSEVAIVVSKGPELFPIPSVAGSGLEEARAAVIEAGFVVGEETEAHHDSVARGVVISQDPAEGEFRHGTPIALVVSIGPELVAVPNVAGRTPEEARAAIEAAGLRFREVADFSDTAERGKVIRSDPASGRQVAKGSQVTVATSQGPRPFPMPKLVGMSLQEAKAKAQELGLVVANEYAVPGSGNPRGQVQGQNPPEGTEVRRGTNIDLYHAA